MRDAGCGIRVDRITGWEILLIDKITAELAFAAV
jgi:hypothetical protein